MFDSRISSPPPLLLKSLDYTEVSEPTGRLLSTLELTFWGWLGSRRLLGMQELSIAVVSDLEHKAAIHYTVPGLEAAMGEVSVMQVSHALGWT